MPPTGYEPYAPPVFARGRPSVIAWFRVYALLMLCSPPAFLVAWAFLTPPGSRESGETRPLSLSLLAPWLIVIVPFVGFWLTAAMVPYRPWGWTFALVAICFGLPSCLTPLAIPLFVFWLKPETKAAFSRI